MLRGMLLELFLYIISYSLLAMFCVYICKKIKNKKVASIITVLLCIIYASIRYNVGSDYDTYYKQYNGILDYFGSVGQILKADYQFGFNLLEYLTKTIIQNEYAIFLVVAVIVYPIKFFIIRKNSKNISESVLLYFLLGFHLVSLNILKQEISMTLILAAYYLLATKKKYRWPLSAVLVAVASTFHLSSIIPVAILLVSKYMKLTKKKIIALFVSTVYLALNYDRIISAIPSFSRYERYVDNINTDYYIVIIGAAGYLVFNLIVLAFLYRRRKELIKENKNNAAIINSLVLSLPFKVLGVINFPIYRLSLYMDQLLLFIIPDLLNTYKKNESKRIFEKQYLFYLLVLMLFFVFSIVFLAHNNFYTYQTIFDVRG